MKLEGHRPIHKILAPIIFVFLIAALIVTGTFYLAYKIGDNAKETQLVTQLQNLRSSFQGITAYSPQFGTDVTCFILMTSNSLSREGIPAECTYLPGAPDIYGRPMSKPTPGVLNAFGGKTLVVFTDDKDRFLAYATKVPAEVCAKFAPDYLRCVKTLPFITPVK